MKVNVNEQGVPTSYEGTIDEIKGMFPGGIWMDVSKIPLEFGANMCERFHKWLEYQKQGICFYDTTIG